MSFKMKEIEKTENNDNKTSEFFEEEEFHHHMDQYESMIIEKNNEIKGNFLTNPSKKQ